MTRRIGLHESHAQLDKKPYWKLQGILRSSNGKHLSDRGVGFTYSKACEELEPAIPQPATLMSKIENVDSNSDSKIQGIL